jgi:hypothetical protein
MPLQIGTQVLRDRCEHNEPFSLSLKLTKESPQGRATDVLDPAGEEKVIDNIEDIALRIPEIDNAAAVESHKLPYFHFLMRIVEYIEDQFL